MKEDLKDEYQKRFERYVMIEELLDYKTALKAIIDGEEISAELIKEFERRIYEYAAAVAIEALISYGMDRDETKIVLQLKALEVKE